MPRSCTLAMLMWFILSFAIYIALFRSIASGAISPWAVLAAVIFIFWIAAPIGLKLRHWSSPDPVIEMIDLSSDEIPKAFATAYHQAEQSMEDIGFRLAGCLLRSQNPVPGGTTVIALFGNAKHRATAQCSSPCLSGRVSLQEDSVGAHLHHRVRGRTDQTHHEQ